MEEAEEILYFSQLQQSIQEDKMYCERVGKKLDD